MPLRAAESAVTCAANGVDLRDPLKPAEPADSQTITAPSRSVSATIVLLNDVLMCAWPMAMFFLTRRRVRPRVRFSRRCQLSPLLAFADQLLRAFASACVRFRPLTVHRQAAAMADPAIAGDLDQTLDCLLSLAPQIALDLEILIDVVAELVTSSSVRSRTLVSGDSPKSVQILSDVERPTP